MLCIRRKKRHDPIDMLKICRFQQLTLDWQGELKQLEEWPKVGLTFILFSNLLFGTWNFLNSTMRTRRRTSHSQTSRPNKIGWWVLVQGAERHSFFSCGHTRLGATWMRCWEAGWFQFLIWRDSLNKTCSLRALFALRPRVSASIASRQSLAVLCTNLRIWQEETGRNILSTSFTNPVQEYCTSCRCRNRLLAF